MKIKFTPVLLGTDINAYGLARCFYEYYNTKSHAFGYKMLRDTEASKIVKVHAHKGFDTYEVFVKVLKNFAEKHRDENLLLISCSDGYTRLLSQAKNLLKDYYLFNVVDPSLQGVLEDKISFYGICEEYGLPCPKTRILTGPEKSLDWEAFTYPVVLKPNDSVEYLNTRFPGKKKAYVLKTEEELATALRDIYQAGYSKKMLLQDYIPGGTEAMAVLNTYSDKNGKVRMMSYGRCLLDEVLPANIGNYNALVTEDSPEVYRTYKDFLEKIGYVGYGNFDLKFDSRDGQYKVFEMNLRQGRSSFYMAAGGLNYVEFFVKDMLDLPLDPTHYHKEGGLWLYVDPYVLKKYVAPEDKDLVKELLKDGYTMTMDYKKDRSLKRLINTWKRRISTIKYYPKYFERL